MICVVYACLTEQHDLRLVAPAALVCFLSCFTAVNFFAYAEDSAILLPITQIAAIAA
jgi:NO-binding membrane sensor protein with MHYT domain